MMPTSAKMVYPCKKHPQRILKHHSGHAMSLECMPRYNAITGPPTFVEHLFIEHLFNEYLFNEI